MATLGASAQLSTRVNDSSVIKVGTRPEQGDFAFYLSSSFQEIDQMVDDDIEVTGIPLIHLRYYLSDDVALGLGIQTYKSKKFLSGRLPQDETGTINDISIESRYLVSPRIEYHFSDHNILDTYVGLEIPVGYEKDIVEFGEKYNLSGDYTNERSERTSFVYGYSIFAGFQAFIADLPMAIGLELGVRGFNHGDMTYKNTKEYSINGVEHSQTYYTTDNNGYSAEYDELNYSKFELGSDLRITLNYFFSR
jgi:hypothetical protein